ncbi:MAG: hypothetical protein K6A36_03510 [Paludibacteraceae bacterium]|nr:hypothetical protein [Paludibacteraceae bacterium]
MAIDLPKQGFGMQIGFAAPTLRLNDKSLNPKDSLINVTKLNGLKLGIVYDASYIAGFGSTLGINYTFAANTTPWVQKYQMKTQPETHTRTFYHEVEVFVDWQYKFELAKETYLMLYTGPSIQYGIAFNVYKDERAWGTITPLPEETKLRYHAEGDEQLKNLNVTWGVGAGFQYQRFFLRGGYDFGILNPYKNTKFEGSDRYTRGRLDQWSIKVGMYFLYK